MEGQVLARMRIVTMSHAGTRRWESNWRNFLNTHLFAEMQGGEADTGAGGSGAMEV